MPRPSKNALATLGGMKAEYAGMVDNRFRRQRVGVSSVGGSGDSHYYAEARFMRMREYVRAMVRDDSAFKFLVNRSVANEHGVGYQYEPDTGDKAINRTLKAAMDEWAKDRRRCDASGRRTLAEMGQIVVFSDKVDGDVFAAGQEDGSIRLYEADEVRSPTWAKNKRIIHGIELDPFRRHVRYYFVKDPVQQQPATIKVDQFAPIEAYDEEGFEQVWQVGPSRPTCPRPSLLRYWCRRCVRATWW
jgi:capsid protein